MNEADFREEKDSLLEEIPAEQEGKVAGGWRLGSDEFTEQQYLLAGVSWKKNTWSKDKYFFRGCEISQSRAEDITRYWFRNVVGWWTEEDLRNIGF